ncbi:MAG: hypothetical protein ACK5JS_05625, partial [Mangrovibacterium sp.]
GVEFATKEQLKRYNDYRKSKQVPVFVAIGLGGTGEAPEQLFIVPLDELKDNFIHIDQLEVYRKQLDKNFFFNAEKRELK